MYERPETAIAKADVLSLDCTALWFLTETHRGFRHKNAPLTALLVALPLIMIFVRKIKKICTVPNIGNEALYTVYKTKNVTSSHSVCVFNW